VQLTKEGFHRMLENVSRRVVIRQICTQIREIDKNKIKFNTFSANRILKITIITIAFVALPKSE
jgi:hypothetical protein